VAGTAQDRKAVHVGGPGLPTVTREPRRSIRSRLRHVGAGSPTQRLILLLILGVAFSLRFAWCVYAARAPRIGDPAAYWFYGTQIAEGNGYHSFTIFLARVNEIVAGEPRALPEHNVPTAMFPPGYPAVLGALFWLVIRSPLPDNLVAAAVSLNVALSVATVLLAFEIARRLFDIRVGLVTAALLAVYPNLIYYTATLHWETTFIFIAMAALLVLIRRPWPDGQVPTRTLITFAVLLGFSVLIRPMSLGIVVALFVASLVAGAGLRRAFAQCGIVTGVVALMVLPWTVRNVVKMHAPVVIATEVGPALCVSRQPGATGAKDLRFMHRYCEPPMPEVPVEKLEVARNDHATAKSVEFVVHHPFQELRLWVPRIRHAYRHDRDAMDDVRWFVPDSSVRALSRVANGFYFGVLTLAAVGAWSFARRAEPGRLLFLLTTASLAATPILLYGAPRYKVPATAFLTVFAAAGVVTIVDRLRARPPEPPEPLGAGPATSRRATAR
jgi:dolichyl-phosphate-mannose-protein mannosyltransferase